MFVIHRSKGFHLVFENGWTASVQFGIGDCCEHHNSILTIGSELEVKRWQSETAEVAAWSHNGEFITLDNGETVKGWLTADEVLAFFREIASK